MYLLINEVHMYKIDGWWPSKFAAMLFYLPINNEQCLHFCMLQMPLTDATGTGC